MSFKLEPVIWLLDTGQRIACFDRCLLIITWSYTWLYINKVHSKPGQHVYQPIIWRMAAMLRNSNVAAIGPTRPREIPLATITWENQFLGFLYFPIWVWGSAWRPLGPLLLRYKILYAKFYLDPALLWKSITISEAVLKETCTVTFFANFIARCCYHTRRRNEAFKKQIL